MSRRACTLITTSILLAYLASSALAADPALQCEAGKLKEAGKYGYCRFKADAKSALKGAPADYAKCESRFLEKWLVIEGKAGAGICPSEGDATSIGDRIDSDVADVASLLAGIDIAECGNNLIEGNEQCDGTDLGGITCSLLGYASGVLTCTAGCSYNIGGCTPYPQPSTCGNGVIDGGEDCDLLPGGVGAETCETQDQGVGGRLRCAASCVFDYGTCPAVGGCADGEREGFVGQTTHPDIAGCSGGWSVAGTLATPRAGCVGVGDDSGNPNGTGCSAADLCAEGWHVCETPADVAASSPDGCGSATQLGDPSLFFAQRQSSEGNAICSATGANDLFGCGNVGSFSQCPTVDRSSGNACQNLPSSWNCGANVLNEANQVVKTASSDGGVLCCRGSDAKIAFVAGQMIEGNATVAGYDALCNLEAGSVGLPGVYKAWISTATTGPATTFTHAIGQYVRTDGVVVANGWADLTDGALAAPINRNSVGSQVSALVWSNTAANGTPANLGGSAFSDSCNDWTSLFDYGAVGDTTQTDSRWTSLPYAQGGQQFCSDFFGLSFYCFQQ